MTLRLSCASGSTLSSSAPCVMRKGTSVIFSQRSRVLRVGLVDRFPRIEKSLVELDHILVATPHRVFVARKGVADRRAHRGLGGKSRRPPARRRVGSRCSRGLRDALPRARTRNPPVTDGRVGTEIAPRPPSQIRTCVFSRIRLLPRFNPWRAPILRLLSERLSASV